MKRILITGKGSYIGTNFKCYIATVESSWIIDELDVRGDNWHDFDFSSYDVVLHVAGIAHISERNVGADIYYKVNRDLAIKIAQRAKSSGVKQIILLSTMAIYAKNEQIITLHTKPAPYNSYGKSKYEAEQKIMELGDESFVVTVVRPPMVYGKDCPGNFTKLLVLAKFSLFFPSLRNDRSMIHILNLCSFFKSCITLRSGGVFFPQNKAYVSTCDIVVAYRKICNHHTYLVSAFNGVLSFFIQKISLVNKVFGDKVYSRELSATSFEYIVTEDIVP